MVQYETIAAQIEEEVRGSLPYGWRVSKEFHVDYWVFHLYRHSIKNREGKQLPAIIFSLCGTMLNDRHNNICVDITAPGSIEEFVAKLKAAFKNPYRIPGFDYG